MLLVDSSVWILKYDQAQLRGLFEEEIVTCLPVIEEVLRGTPTEEKYRSWLADFQAMSILDSPMPWEAFEDAARIYRTGRAAGITICSSYDCLIAACALRHGAEVLHADRDFGHIARVTALKQRNLSDFSPSA